MTNDQCHGPHLTISLVVVEILIIDTLSELDYKLCWWDPWLTGLALVGFDDTCPLVLLILVGG